MSRIEDCLLYEQDLTPCCGRVHWERVGAVPIESWTFPQISIEPIPVLVADSPKQVGDNWVTGFKLNPEFLSSFSKANLFGIRLEDDFSEMSEISVETPVICYCPLSK